MIVKGRSYCKQCKHYDHMVCECYEPSNVVYIDTPLEQHVRSFLQRYYRKNENNDCEQFSSRMFPTCEKAVVLFASGTVAATLIAVVWILICQA